MDKFDVIENWIANVQYSHSKSERTGPRYRRELRTFLNFIDKTAEQILEDYENMRDRDFRRKYAQYLRALVAKKDSEGYAPNTINCMVTAIKSFFKYNDLPLGYVPTGQNRVVFHNRDISKAEIEQILEISKPRDEAFFCMMAQSGLRPATLVELKYEHIQEEFENKKIPMKIFVPDEIAKGRYGSFFTFVGEEAVNRLKAYFNSRGHQIKPSDYLFVSRDGNSKLNTKSISKIFNHAVKKLEKTGKIREVKRQTVRLARKESVKQMGEVRLYNLRKFFRKQAGQAGVEYVNFWMGHKTNYKAPYIPASDIHYFSRENVEAQRTLYTEKAMPHLRIGNPTPSETEQTIEELRDQLRREQELRVQKDKLIQEQNERLQSLEKFQKETLTRIQELAEFRREMKHFEKGGAVVTYYSKSGFLPKEVEEVADEALERQKEKFLKEAKEIDKVLRRRRK